MQNLEVTSGENLETHCLWISSRLPHLCLCKRHIHLLRVCVYTEYVDKHTRMYGVAFWGWMRWHILTNSSKLKWGVHFPAIGHWHSTPAVATLKSPAGLRIAGFFPIAFIALAPPTSGLSLSAAASCLGPLLLLLQFFDFEVSVMPYQVDAILPHVPCEKCACLFGLQATSAKAARSVHAEGF